MSEKERIELSEKIRKGILKGQREMLERKKKLGETVIIADENGMPLEITAEEALKRYKFN